MRVTTQIIGNEITECKFRSVPLLMRVSKFDEESAKKFSEFMSKAHESGQPVIPIVIDSYGGYVDSLISMISDIQNAEKPVATIAVGKAMSCGSFLLSMGTDGYRFIDKNARVMIHEISGGSRGKHTDIVASTEEMKRLNERLFKIMARNCGKPEDFFIKEMFKRGNADWYLSPTETKNLGIANFIRVPKMTRTVTVETRFE